MEHYYLFFNPASGNIQGQLLIPFGGTEAEIAGAKFYFYNMKDQRKEGFNHIKEIELDYIYLVIAGGDGTIMWVVEEMINFGLDVNRCVIIPLPFGTGNDFSNSIGWGTAVPTDVIGKNYSVLISFLEKWRQQGIQTHFDIWDVQVKVRDGGFISEVSKQTDGFVYKKLNLNKLTHIKRMSNYFSVGVDARIGFGFDKRRTTSRCCNKCMYCWEGFKKMFLKTPKVNDVIEQVDQVEEMESKLLFKTAQNDFRDQTTIPGNPVNLVCLNINSYSGGVSNIWRNATSANPNAIYTDASFSDGKLEFLTFNSIIGLGSERISPGNATRINQSRGPFSINFKKGVSTYFQVDGQYFRVQDPSMVQIAPCDKLPNGKIRVLINKFISQQKS